MGKIAFIFPGQGAQKAGMGKDFYEHSAAAAKIYETAGELLGFSVTDLCFTENDRLDITEYTQAAMVTTSIAMLSELHHRGYACDVTAGLSLGEYCALTACRALNFEDAVQVVRQRGILMQEAVPQGKGGMAAVLGMTGDAVARVTDLISGVTVANYNCPGQVVISGEQEAVTEACVKLKEAGAKRTVMLNVSGPFHSQMLTEAGAKLAAVLAGITVHDPVIPYVTNVTASYITDASKVKELLQRQVSSSVMWEQSIKAMIADGTDRFVEIGPGKTLASFVKKISRETAVYNVEKWEDLEGLQGFL